MYYRCAFTNTPKYQKAKTQGGYRIVKSDWIDKCHTNRCRFPWRRYSLKYTYYILLQIVKYNLFYLDLLLINWNKIKLRVKMKYMNTLSHFKLMILMMYGTTLHQSS